MTPLHLPELSDLAPAHSIENCLGALVADLVVAQVENSDAAPGQCCCDRLGTLVADLVVAQWPREISFKSFVGSLVCVWKFF